MKKIILLLVLALMLMHAPIKTHASNARNTRTCVKEHINMGTFKLTAYCPCESCSDNFGRQTSSGKTATAGRTIAVDPEVIDIGSRVLIGDHIYTAEDIGGFVDGDHIDIFFDTHEEVEEFGLRWKNVWVVR